MSAQDGTSKWSCWSCLLSWPKINGFCSGFGEIGRRWCFAAVSAQWQSWIMNLCASWRFRPSQLNPNINPWWTVLPPVHHEYKKVRRLKLDNFPSVWGFSPWRRPTAEEEHMSSGRYLLHQAIGGVFLPRSPVPYGFWRLDLVLHSHIVFACRTYFWLAGWWLAALAGLGWLGWLAAGCWLGGWLIGWCLAGGWLAGWPAGWLGLAGWLALLAGCWLAGSVAGCIYYMIMDGWYLMDVGSPVLWAWIWPRSDLVLTSYWTSYLYCPWICICCIGYINEKRWT